MPNLPIKRIFYLMSCLMLECWLWWFEGWEQRKGGEMVRTISVLLNNLQYSPQAPPCPSFSWNSTILSICVFLTNFLEVASKNNFSWKRLFKFWTQYPGSVVPLAMFSLLFVQGGRTCALRYRLSPKDQGFLWKEGPPSYAILSRLNFSFAIYVLFEWLSESLQKKSSCFGRTFNESQQKDPLHSSTLCKVHH